MSILSQIAMIISIGIILLVILYPCYSFIMATIFDNEVKKSIDFREPVSIIICCYNEAAFISDRIEFFLKVNEWIAGSELLVVSGGSTDGTTEIIREYDKNPKVKCFLFNERKTKIKGINFAVPKCKNNLLIFSDCRQTIEPNSIINLVQNFNDPKIGTVTCTLVDSKGNRKPSLIRKILKSVAFNDGKHGSCLNVYGALYAQRKSVFRPFPANLLFEDLYVVVSTLRQRKRVIQDSKAIINDINFEHYYKPERIRRLARGLMIFIRYHSKLIFSLPFPQLFRFIVFKYLKLLIPFAFIILGFQLIPFLFNPTGMYIVLGLVLVISLNPHLRKIVIQTFQFNYHFLASIVNFTTGKNQSKDWEKLKIKTEMNISDPK